MKTIAIIGASYLQRPLVEKANQMGLRTICFAWSDGAVCRGICDTFYDISVVEKDKILQICQQEQIDAICTIASDVAAPTVAYVAEKMGLVGNSYECSVKANNKFLMRNAFVCSGVPCPRYMMVTSVKQALDSYIQYPLIVKPSDRSGSAGVTKVENKEQLITAVDTALNTSFKKEAMIEEFIDGREISVEFISYKGKHYPLQITDKVTTGAPHFVELEHHQPANLPDEMFVKIYEITNKALDSLGITNGASHAEYIITDEGRIVAVEIGGRMGGDFIGSDLVRLSTGYDFVKGVIVVALGEFEEPKKTISKYSGIYFLCKDTKRIKPIIDSWECNPVFIEGKITDKDLRNVTCSADRSGYIIYRNDSKVEI